MNTIKNFLIIGMMAIGVHAIAQKKINTERMDRDIKVAENVLGTLLSSEIDNLSFRYASRSISGQYVEGYGVVFTLPNSLGFPNFTVVRTSGQSGTYDLKGANLEFEEWDENHRKDKKRAEVHVERKERLEKAAEDLATRAEEVAVRVLSGGSRNVDGPRGRSSSGGMTEVDRDQVIEVIKTFALDYGDLLSELPEGERIMVADGRMGWGGRPIDYFKASSGAGANLTVSVQKNVISDYKAGKITKEAARGKFLVDTSETKETSQDIEVFSSVISRLYRSDLSETYFSNRNLQHEYLEGYGVIFWMKVYSSTMSDKTYFIETLNRKGLTREERNKIVEEMYPKFVESLKSNILEYGRMVKSLKPNEKVIFKVNLTECEPCDMPKEVEISVTKEVLEGFASRRIKEKNALEQMVVKPVR